MRSCSNCRFGVECGPNLQDLTAPRAVDCRRYPPEVVPINSPHGSAAILLPRNVPATHWCGEYLTRQRLDS